MRAALFVTCVNDAVYPSVGVATVRLLERLGVEVVFPEGQSCCGQPQFNSGYRREAGRLAGRMVEVFEGFDFVVTPSGSCAAMVRHQFPRVGGAGAVGLAGRVFELSEFLVDVVGVTDVGAYFPHVVAYHPSCHGLRVLGLGDRPRRLLEAVGGLELRELPGAQECCGFGGTFAVKNADVSSAMGRDKVGAVVSTGAGVLCGGDSSCLMHVGGIAGREGAPVRMVHLAEVLASTEEVPWS